MRMQRNRHSLVGFANRRRIDSRVREALLMAAALLPMIFLWGCSGIVSGKNTQPQNTPPQTYLISGTITPIAGGSGATVTLSGAANATTTTDASGNFTFTALANGAYTVTPTHTGYTFSPTSLSVTVNGANVTTGVNFAATATAQTYSLSGTISPAAGGSGATVALSGAASATVTANGSGTYTFTGLANGTYTVTPTRTGYTFSPSSQNATVNGANVTGINFTATVQTAPTFSISGTISPVAGGSGATVVLSGVATASTTADGSGNFKFSGLPNGNYAVTPSHTGYTFSPTSQSAPINGANVTGINFTATAQTAPTYSISGTISPTTGGVGATVLLSGPAAATTTTNSAGNYTFTGLANGTYTITPSNTGFTFTPPSQGVTVSSANVTGVNFTATAQQAHSVALSWDVSTSAVSGYNVYRSTVSGTGYAKINSSLVPTIAYTDTTVVNGTTYYYVTTAVDSSGNESVFSNEVSAPIP
jgi:hypothetical protein